ncbi:NAD(P)-binding protein, partial [Aureobasidium melanogenum]
MAAMIGRVWSAFNPPLVTKRDDALKFGILGAANIAPLSLIIPAKSHPEMIVQAVAARDRSKAEAFAKSHGIPEVKDSYQDILDNPNIDCVFIPLPNGLHYEWAVRAIRAGKHVLLEKPSTSNSTEAKILFDMPELSQPNGPVILEAFHNRFYPSWNLFKSMINPADVVHVTSNSMIPWWASSKDDIHFNYNISGGTMMAMGTYNYAALRLLFDADPAECTSCDTKAYTDGVHDKCDYEFQAKFRFPNGGIGEASSTLQGGTILKPSFVTVTTRETIIPDKTLPDDQEKLQSQILTLNGMIHGVFWHRIDIKSKFEIRSKETGKIVKRWEENSSRKAYTFKEAGGEFADLPGETFWMSYRYQLEAFVNKIRGRETQHWVDGQDSIAQMKMIDMAYEKSGLGPRPSSSFS